MTSIAVALLWSPLSQIIFFISFLLVSLGPESFKPGTALKPMATAGLVFVSVNSNSDHFCMEMQLMLRQVYEWKRWVSLKIFIRFHKATADIEKLTVSCSLEGVQLLKLLM